MIENIEYFLNEALKNQVVYTAFVLLIGLVLSRRFANNIYIYAFFHFIGTFIHEVLHFVVSLLMYGKPSRFTLFPKKEAGGLVLGSVSHSNLSWYNRLPIGLAPTLVWIPLFFVDMYYFSYFERNIYSMLGYSFLICVLIINSFPSSEDLKVAFGCVTGLIAYLILGTIIYSIFFKGLI